VKPMFSNSHCSPFWADKSMASNLGAKAFMGLVEQSASRDPDGGA
jgi:hypothetical protein